MPDIEDELATLVARGIWANYWDDPDEVDQDMIDAAKVYIPIIQRALL